MVIVDANVLLYAVNESSPQHAIAKRWLERALNGAEVVGFAWVVLLAFVRLATLPALFSVPLDTPTALELVDDWLGAKAAAVVHPTAQHATILRRILTQTGAAGNLVTDAHLATLCLEHGAQMCTYDRDFSRFPGLIVFVPS
jgi:toxin-antitoxin system PIN domain toxin